MILLAALTAITVQICKATFLKKLRRKLLTFLPFVLGTVFYAAYAAVKNLSVIYLLEEYVTVLEHGISVGAVATLLYVLYEQFVRDKKTVSASQGIISALIEGYVPTDRVEEVAKLIANAIEKDVTGNGATRAAEILTDNAEGEITEQDIRLLSRLIIEALAKVNV